MRKLIIATIAAASLVGLTACNEEPSATKSENKARLATYSKLVKAQPAHSMDYSPTRATKNFWIDTWGHKGKVSYVYLMDSSSNVFGYFVLDGLPVSYCTSLIPPYRIDDGGSNTVVVPGPSVDGTYASAANCNVYYGKDAVTGSYVEYTSGMGINALVFDQPMPQYGDAKPLGPGRIGQVKR